MRGADARAPATLGLEAKLGFERRLRAVERGEEAAARAPLDLNELLPTDRRYFTYMGSLTTPPCSEGVQWIVMRQPVTVTAEQIELFARIYPMNSRPLQAAAGRRILQSN